MRATARFNLKHRQACAMRHKRICRRSLATSDGLRRFDYDEANRISKARIFKDGEASRITRAHQAGNAVRQQPHPHRPGPAQGLGLGQRGRSQPQL